MVADKANIKTFTLRNALKRKVKKSALRRGEQRSSIQKERNRKRFPLLMRGATLPFLKGKNEGKKRRDGRPVSLG